MSWLSRLLSRDSDTDETRYRVTYEKQYTNSYEQCFVTLKGGVEKELWLHCGDYYTEPFEDGEYVHVNGGNIMMIEYGDVVGEDYWDRKSRTFDDAAEAIEYYEKKCDRDKYRDVDIHVIDDG